MQLDFNKSRRFEIKHSSDIDAKSILEKGWSFSYVYHLSEIRDIYLVLKEIGFSSLKEFTVACFNRDLPYVKTKWNERRVLEHLNALKNFKLVGLHNQIVKNVFTTSQIGDPLSMDDLNLFREIYFSYLRFQEIFSWFIPPLFEERQYFLKNLNENILLEQSIPLYTFSNKSRFTDSFFYEIKNNTDLYYIESSKTVKEDKNEDLMRFWDVFVKWGTVLGVIEKFNLKTVGITTVNNKTISCTYIISNTTPNFNLLDFVKAHYTTNYIYIPELIFDIAVKLRLKVETIQRIIIDQYLKYKEYLSLERTSEIFIKNKEIKEGEKILFPKYNDSFISHLIVRT